MRNKNMVYTAVLASAIAVLLSLFTVYAADETEVSDVVFLDGSYTVTGEETSEQGMSAEFPFTSIAEAYGYFTDSDGGTIVVSGRTRFYDYTRRVAAKQYTGTVVFTSKYGDTDYAETNGAKLVLTAQFHQRGDVRYENITFVSRQNTFMHGNGHKMIFGEGVEVLMGTPEDQNLLVDGEYVATTQYLVLRGGAESAAIDGDTYIEINSGKFSTIHAATKTRGVSGDVNIVINSAEYLPGSINLGNDVAKVNGVYYSGTIGGSINVTLNTGIVQKFNINYIEKIAGGINIAVNGGGAYSFSGKTAEPDMGTNVILASGDGKATVEGLGRFRLKADDGYVGICDAIDEGASFFTDEVVEVNRETSTVHFIDRVNKPFPIYVSSITASSPDASDGILTGTSRLIEYRLQGEESFTVAVGTTVEGLKPGIYEVRYIAEGGYAAGEIGEVKISGRSGEYIVEESLALREKRIGEIRSTPSALNPSDYAVTFYVSPNGDDTADGLSPETAWRSLSKASAVSRDKNYVEGDTLVLFERGGLWRRETANSPALTLTAGVDYSAYTGNLGDAKPTFYGSPENGAESEKWTLYYSDNATGAKIWKYATNLPDVGVIVFNEGEENSVKEIPDYYDGEYFVRGTKKEVPFTVETCLDNDLEFFNEYTDGQTSVYVPKLTGSVLYLRCDRGNPGEVFDSIEFNTRTHIVQNASNTVADNICIKYGGSHGFGGGAPENTVFQNLEIGWIGGVVQMYEKSTAGEFGTVTRFGNGIEIWQNCDGFYINNCYVYQCYDAGITHQGRGANVGGDGTNIETNAYMKDVKFTNNVLEYNVYNIEYFLSRLAPEYVKYPYPMMTDIYYTDNLMFYAGYGFGKQRPNPGLMTHIRTGSDNPATNFHIDNNLFFDSVDYCTVTMASKEEWLPKYSGNTFVQTRGRYLAMFGTTSARYAYDESARMNTANILGDRKAELFYLEAKPELSAIYDGGKITVSGLCGAYGDKTALSVDGGETWLTELSSDSMSFDPSEVGTICAYTFPRDNSCIKSEIVEAEIVSEFDFADGTLTAYNGSEKTVFLPESITALADNDVSILGTPDTVYVSPRAETLAALLSENGIVCRLYGDVNLDGKVDSDDLSALIMSEAAGTVLPDGFTADVSFDGNVTLYDLSLLMKYLAGGEVSLGRVFKPLR